MTEAERARLYELAEKPSDPKADVVPLWLARQKRRGPRDVRGGDPRDARTPDPDRERW